MLRNDRNKHGLAGDRKDFRAASRTRRRARQPRKHLFRQPSPPRACGSDLPLATGGRNGNCCEDCRWELYLSLAWRGDGAACRAPPQPATPPSSGFRSQHLLASAGRASGSEGTRARVPEPMSCGYEPVFHRYTHAAMPCPAGSEPPALSARLTPIWTLSPTRARPRPWAGNLCRVGCSRALALISPA